MVFGSGGVRIVQDCGESVAGGFAQFYIALDDGVEHQFLEVAFHLVVYLVGLAQRESYMVSRNPSISSAGFSLDLMILMVFSNLLMPSSAKYSACTGMITESAAVSALIVINPNDGEQSIRI